MSEYDICKIIGLMGAAGSVRDAVIELVGELSEEYEEETKTIATRPANTLRTR